MARARNSTFGVMLLIFLFCMINIAHSLKEWTVGDDEGWTFGVAGWENRGKRFQGGDVLVFKYDPKMHNVVEVEQGDYQSCAVSGPSKTYTSGDDHIKLAADRAFFICSVPGHCQNGMKLAITAE